MKEIGIMMLCLNLLLTMSCKQDTKESILHTTGDSEIDKLSEQIAIDSVNAKLYFSRSQLFYEKGLFDEAIADLKSAIGIDSLQVNYYHALSNAYMDYFKSKQALSIMEKAASIFSDRIPTLLKLSETQLILKKHEEMNITLRRIISKDPQNAEAYFMMGMMFRSLEEMDKAKNAFQAAVEMDPELIDGWLLLGNIYEAEGNPLALQYFKSSTQADPNNIEALHSLAFYLQNHNQIDEALQIYRQINGINRNYPDAYLNAGILLLEQMKIEDAFEQFNILVGITPQNHLGYYYRGITNEMLEKIEEARGDYQTSINFNPKFDKAIEAMESISKQDN